MLIWKYIIVINLHLKSANKNHLYSFILVMFPGSEGLFQKDNATLHQAQVTWNWFQEHSTNFQLLHWPMYSLHRANMRYITDITEFPETILNKYNSVRESLRICLDRYTHAITPTPLTPHAISHRTHCLSKRKEYIFLDSFPYFLTLQ